MKKIILIAIVLIIGVSAQAQNTTKRGWTRGAIDTVSDAGTTALYQSDSLYFSGNNGTWAVAFNFWKDGGTPAGYAILQTSPDGYNWSNYSGTSADSFAITNVDSAVHTWFVNGARVTNVRLNVVGSGTQETGIRMSTKKN